MCSFIINNKTSKFVFLIGRGTEEHRNIVFGTKTENYLLHAVMKIMLSKVQTNIFTKVQLNL